MIASTLGEIAMTTEDILAKHVGILVLECADRDAVIEQLRHELKNYVAVLKHYVSLEAAIFSDFVCSDDIRKGQH